MVELKRRACVVGINVKTKVATVVAGVVVVTAVVLLIVNFDPVRHWTAIHIGSINESGPFYGFWSGFGSDISEFAIALGIYTGVRKVNCHSRRCWRIGHHPLDGTPYHLCRVHHPDVPRGGAKLEDILAQYKKYQDSQGGAAGAAPTASAATAAKKSVAKKAPMKKVAAKKVTAKQ
jgi:hypothetical protein